MWIHVPSQFLASAPESVASSWDSSSLYRTLASSCVLSGKPSPWQSWKRVCETALWMTQLSGQIPEPSMASRGVERLIASLADRPASPSASPGSDAAWPTNDSSGTTLPGLSGKSSPPMRSLRTSQASLPLMGEHSSTACSVPWSPSGSIVNGTYSPRRKRVPRTSGNAGSAWPSATIDGNYNRQGASAKAGDGLATAAQNWPTPDTMAHRSGASLRKGNNIEDGGSHSVSLHHAVEFWQTPGTDSFRSRGGDRKDEMGLDQQARLWPTPSANQYEPTDLEAMLRRRERIKAQGINGNGFGLTTAMAAQLWATPTVQDGKNTAGASQFDRNSHPLNVEAVMWATPRAEHDSGKHRGTADTVHSQIKSQWPTPVSSPNANRTTKRSPSEINGTHGERLSGVAIEFTHQPETTTPDGQPSRRVLNPRFAEMLMGWPPGWTQPCLPIATTDFARWETASVHSLVQQLGLSCVDELEVETA